MGCLKSAVQRVLNYNVGQESLTAIDQTDEKRLAYQRSKFTLRFKDAELERRFKDVWFDTTIRSYRICVTMCIGMALFTWGVNWRRFMEPWQLQYNHILHLGLGVPWLAVMVLMTYTPFARRTHSWFNAFSMTVLYIGSAWAYNVACSRDALNSVMHVCFCITIPVFAGFMKVPFLEHFISTHIMVMVHTVPLFVMSAKWDKFVPLDTSRWTELAVVTALNMAAVMFANIQCRTSETFWREHWSSNQQLSVDLEDLRVEIDKEKAMLVPALLWDTEDEEATINDTAKMSKHTMSSSGIVLSPSVLKFGVKRGLRIPVAQVVTDTLTVTNNTSEVVEFRMYVPNGHGKFSMEMQPGQGTLKSGESRDVQVSLTLNCTMTVKGRAIKVEIRSCDGETVYATAYTGISVAGEHSTYIDPDDVTVTTMIGGGGVGNVYRGKTKDGQDVAVKAIKNQGAMTDAMKRDFEREVSIMKRISHQNIVRFVGASHIPGKLSIFTEFINNSGSLEWYIKSAKSMHVILKLRFMKNVASAMKYLHDNGVLYRDFKPANVLVVSLRSDAVVNAKLIDFGTPVDVEDVMEMRNYGGGAIGTPIYMAPEMFDSGVAGKMYNGKVDVYSFGISLWEIFTQQQPWENVIAWDIPDRVQSGERPTIPDDLSDSMTQLIRDCWTGLPDKRPTFDEINEILDAELEHATGDYANQLKHGKVDADRLVTMRAGVTRDMIFDSTGGSSHGHTGDSVPLRLGAVCGDSDASSSGKFTASSSSSSRMSAGRSRSPPTDD